MKSKDQIIDACLAELIGNEAPPDLTSQILSRLPKDAAGGIESSPAEATSSGSSDVTDPLDGIIHAGLEELLAGVAAPQDESLSEEVAARLALGDQPAPPVAAVFHPTPPPLPTPPPTSEPVAIRTKRPRRSTQRHRAPWLLVATSAAALLLAGAYYWRQGPGGVTGVAGRPSDQHAGSERPGAAPHTTGPKSTGSKSTGSKSISPANPKAANDGPKNPGRGKLRPEPPQRAIASSSDVPPLDPFNESLFPIDELFVNTSDDEGALNLDDEAALEEALSSSQQLTDDEVIRAMNQLLARSWRDAGVTTVPAADDSWCRRLYLQLLGRIPTVDELEAFANDQQPHRRERLIRSLQDTKPHQEEYAGYWAAVWSSFLVGQRGGMAADDVASRADLERYLAESILTDKPYDQIVRELISATGSSRPEGKDYNPATNFLLACMDDGGDDKGILATARTFEVFHNRQVKCVQCHAHPTDTTWSQRDFWSLNAFFRQMKMRRRGSIPSLVDQDFPGEGPGGIREAEVFFEQLNGETVAALPAYPGRKVNAASGRLSQVNRRQLLADLVAADPQLARATVNRLWAHFHGYGFTKPVEDMGADRPVSHPDLLELLAKQFRLSGYSFDRLIRWVASSDGFSRSSQMTLATTGDEPETGSAPLFSRYYTRQLAPEVVYDSLAMVADSGRPRSLEGRADFLGQFIQPMGTDEGQESSTFGSDVRQSLIIMNGPLMRKATNRSNREGLLHEVVQSQLRFAEKVERLFLAAVARKPTRRELASVRELLDSQGGAGESEVLETVWWALLNSNEFILDH